MRRKMTLHRDNSEHLEKYGQLVLRNSGYVSSELQNTIRDTSVLVAGCGIGSNIAEAAVRLGFRKFILIDGDQVEPHNLNRQAFSFADVGKFKVNALADRILQINPNAQLERHCTMLNSSNAAELVKSAEMIFDTIDFLDLPAITALHDECHRQLKPAVSAVSAGWGAAAVFFPPARHPGEHSLFREIFGLPLVGSVEGASYVEHFSKFLATIAARLDPSVVAAMSRALTKMQDGSPCPAPHVVAGAYSVAGLATTIAAHWLDGRELICAPEIILVSLSGTISSSQVQRTFRSAA